MTVCLGLKNTRESIAARQTAMKNESRIDSSPSGSLRECPAKIALCAIVVKTANPEKKDATKTY